MQKQILKILEKVIFDNYNLEKKNLKLEVPPKKELGDYAFPGFQLAKDLKKNPNLIVQELKNFLKPYVIPAKAGIYNSKNTINDSETSSEGQFSIIESLATAGPYLNIKINKLNIIGLIKNYSYKAIAGDNKGKTIFVDYIGANVGKPLHIGHMCTPNQGQAMINVYKKLGFTVVSDSHIGDWGIIFGKLILAYKKWGSEKKLKENAVEHLFELYVKISNEVEKDSETSSEGQSFLKEQIRNEFSNLSKGNKDSIKFWESFTKQSIKAMNVQLARLKVKPDFNIGESFYEGLGLPKMEDYPDLKWDMKSIVKELIKKKIATANKDGSVGIEFDKKSKMPSCILQKRDGTHGYLASDLAAIKYRVANWNLDSIIYFVDARQQLHLKQAFYIADKAGWLNGSHPEFISGSSNESYLSYDSETSSKGQKKVQLFHAYNGFISLKDGAMSTRKGKIIKLDKLLDEAEKRAEKIILEKRDDIKGKELKKLSKIIGIGAIKYGYLKKNRETDVIFDWDEFMTFEGNSGPYIQYAYVRAKRILEKSGEKDIYIQNNYDDVKEKIKQEVLDLSKLLLKYNSKDGVLFETAKKNMPHILANYSYKLTKAFNSFYNNVEVLTEKNDKLRDLFLKLTKDFSETIKDCFNLLAIDMPEKM